MPQTAPIQTNSSASFPQSKDDTALDNSKLKKIKPELNKPIPQIKENGLKFMASGAALTAAGIAFAAIGIVSDHKLLRSVSANLGVLFTGAGAFFVGKGSERF
ncbi:MAG: hypothetical protein CMD81_05820 [Gammaproteobacteria bacterium]|nr:hypothetical protein [Gammaproteobacteria bacterium]HBF07990.1 hypothetical protein [Gammaproteobacteria bacterium]|tara:strand:- start:792 stop:1100 length:309 start_codon:yes stop_codon:yes gene_type:complete